MSEPEDVIRQARLYLLRHDSQFYGPMKDATCACPECLVIRPLVAALSLLVAERDEHRGEADGYFVALGEAADKLATVEAERDDLALVNAVICEAARKAKAERDEARADHARWMERCLDNKAEGELADCREALRPLVEACIEAFGADGDWDDDEDISTPGTGITFGMIRQARAALGDE